MLQLEYVARACELGLEKKMKATEIVNNIWPRGADEKQGKGSTEKLKAFLQRIRQPTWGHPGIEADERCAAVLRRIEDCLRRLGR